MTTNVCILPSNEDEDNEMIQFIIRLFSSKHPLYNTFTSGLADKSIVKIMQHSKGLPFISETKVPNDAIDWTTKKKLEENLIMKWHTDGCSLNPINTYVDDDNEYGLISKHTLNNVMRYLTDIVTILLEGVKHQSFQNGWFHGYNQTSKWRPQSHEMMSQNPQGTSVFVLAHLMQRPIVVLSDSSQVAGIYVPIRCTPYSCKKDAIVISYHLGQYSPVIGIIPKDHLSTSSCVTFPLESSGDRIPSIRTFGLPYELKTKHLLTISNYLNFVVYQSNPDEPFNLSIAVILSNDKHNLPLGNGNLVRIVDNGFTLNNNSLIDSNDNGTLSDQCELSVQHDRTCNEQLDERTRLRHCIADSCEQEIGFTTFPFCEDCHKKRMHQGNNGKIRISNNINYGL
ncbi:hypothetical protein CHUAL_007827 [Chamberlinius hualienensis]